MRYYVLAAAALWALMFGQAHAQSPMLPGFPPGTFQNRAALDAGGAAGFVGPLDVSGLGTNVVACYSLRACSSALRGTKAVEACNSTGGTDVGCGDLLTDAVTGQLVAATISGITCPGANCTIRTWYDQSASAACTTTCNVVRTTVASRPTLPSGVLGSFAVARNSTSQDLSGGAPGILTQGNPITLASVARRTSGTGLTQIFGNTTANTALFFAASTAIEAYAGTGPVGIGTGTENAWHNISAMFNGASSVGRVDGVSSGTVNPGSTAFTGTDIGIAGIFTGGPMETVEHIFWAADKSSSLAALCTNQYGYWGTAVSC